MTQYIIITQHNSSHISTNIFEYQQLVEKRYFTDVRLPTDTKDVRLITDTKDVRLHKNVIRRTSNAYVPMKLAKIFQFG